MDHLCFVFVKLSCLFIAALWWPAVGVGGYPLGSLVCDVYCVFVTFLCGVVGQVWNLIVWIPDLCLL